LPSLVSILKIAPFHAAQFGDTKTATVKGQQDRVVPGHHFECNHTQHGSCSLLLNERGFLADVEGASNRSAWGAQPDYGSEKYLRAAGEVIPASASWP